ncbi:hypothetical protein AJ79_00021 [Helicocarpus griseus UAMH5409]|uniref:Amidohydrolase-related domain-containing protein n=1 Tax=Helicocarpus griseus UAMH5409 TaxID=1447875 RepID=A0A2B7YDL3_9EURO|nr:hypothetical protein AJ79_00021 [Helicocarpus griseus UAMH5409]
MRNPPEAPAKTLITNVHIFDGTRFGEQTSLLFTNGGIKNCTDPRGAKVVDGNGGFLIPGVIDAHAHVTSCSQLFTTAQYGVTTVLDLGAFPYSTILECRKAKDASDIYGSGAVATVNGTTNSQVPDFPFDSLLSAPESGRKFVANRVAEGVDYIKVILDPLGPDSATLKAIIEAAHDAGKLVIAHALTLAHYNMAVDANANILTHVPTDKPVDSALTARLTATTDHHRTTIVPTLYIIQLVLNSTGVPIAAYNEIVAGSVAAMYEAGVPIATGTDSNEYTTFPYNPPFGKSLHDELELLVAAGVSPTAAIRAATDIAASAFHLDDRGVIRDGYRADLVLLAADPTADIRNSRLIEKVWIDGLKISI